MIGFTVNCQKESGDGGVCSQCAAGVEWALERTDCAFLPCLSNVWVMTRIWSLTSASSSILVWRCSKIRGSTIPELEAMLLGREFTLCWGLTGKAGWSQNLRACSKFLVTKVNLHEVQNSRICFYIRIHAAIAVLIYLWYCIGLLSQALGCLYRGPPSLHAYRLKENGK
jgi:hypothetical protein